MPAQQCARRRGTVQHPQLPRLQAIADVVGGGRHKAPQLEGRLRVVHRDGLHLQLRRRGVALVDVDADSLAGRQVPPRRLFAMLPLRRRLAT